MISRADEYLIHQTSEPVNHVATSDRRYFDRYFFTGHASSDEIFFLLGLGAYPNLGVVDGFASVAFDGQQHTTRGSRELGGDRMDTRGVGPIDVEVLEPLRTLRFRSTPTEPGGVELDLTWNGAVDMFAEPPILSRVMGRVMEQATRMIQTGTWTGHIRVGDRSFDVTPDRWWGARDRSWGVRSIGFEREPKGIQQAHKVSASRTPLWIWSPMQFPSQTVHFSLSEHANGEREIQTVRRMTADGGQAQELGGQWHELVLDPETRDVLPGSKVGWKDADGSQRTVTLTPLAHAFLRAGTGYGGPDAWRHGAYMGESWESTISHDLSDAALVARIGPSHNCCRMELDTGEVGYGTFESQVFGAFPRYGFDT
jgi:plastocyanin